MPEFIFRNTRCGTLVLCGQHVDLLIAMHGMPQIQPRTQLQIALLKNTFEQQDRATPAQIAHPLASCQVQQGKAIRARRPSNTRSMPWP
jgi:hypothetical protein